MSAGPVRVCYPFVGDTIGGSHLSALLLIAALDPRRYEPVVLLHEDGPLAAHLADAGLGYRLLPLPDYVGRGAGALRHARTLAATAPPLARFLRREGISMVHTNDVRMHLTWCLAARASGRRFVWHQRTVMRGWRLPRVMAGLAHRIVCISDYVAASLPARLRAKAVSIPNPVGPPGPADREAARRRVLAELGAGASERIVCFAANLTEQKRPLVFVEAAGRIAARLAEPCRFVLFGDDREGLAESVRARAEAAGLGGRVHLAGFRAPIERWLAGCDLLLAPAVEEGFGRALVEAMLVGTPVVAADSGGHSEIVRDAETGWLVPADDAAAMAEAVVGALERAEAAAQVAARAREWAARTFSPSAHAERVMALYDRALGAPRT